MLKTNIFKIYLKERKKKEENFTKSETHLEEKCLCETSEKNLNCTEIET